MPKVSVIVPNYNHARFLKQRLDSVFNQTFQDFEVILLDDCSTDNSVEILSEYAKNPNVSHLVVNSENSGNVFKQWNKGVALAKGEYIWIAESDDYCEKEFLETLVPIVESNLQIGLIYSQSQKINQDNELLSIWHPWNGVFSDLHWQKDFQVTGKVEIEDYFLIENTIPNASAVLFRKTLYLQVEIKNERFKLAGDWFTWIKLIEGSYLYFVSKVLNYHRFHDNIVRKNTPKFEMYLDRLILIDYCLRNFTFEKKIEQLAIEQFYSQWANLIITENGIMKRTAMLLKILKLIFKTNKQLFWSFIKIVKPLKFTLKFLTNQYKPSIG